MKVFGIGMFKTGTKSLGAALSTLGYIGLYRPWFILRDAQNVPDNWYNDPDNWYLYYNKIKERAAGYNAFSDAPWMFLFKQLDEWYPGSKFILTLRKSPEILARSDINQWRGKSDTPPAQKFIDRYIKHNQMVIDYFTNKTNLLIMCFENGDGWKKLCKFLNKPIPDKAFPHANKGRYKNANKK